MALLRNDKLKEFDSIVTDITKGQSFVSWSESTVQSIIDKISPKPGEVDIDKILKFKNIIVQNFSNDNTTYKASLINRKTHYELFIDLQKIGSISEKKFVLAHELAHTLFYTETEQGLTKSTSLSYGSEQIENMCDYIAICFLLPKKIIQEEIRKYVIEKETLRKQNENYFKLIFHLAAKLQVDWHLVFYRLIVNLNFLPDSLCFEFLNQEGKWFLTWLYQTDSIVDKNLFITIKSKSENRFVSAKKSFTDILNKILLHFNKTNVIYGSIIIEKKQFYSYYQGNFKQFLQNHFTDDLDIVKIYYRINIVSNNEINSILMLFPFNGLLKNKGKFSL